MSHSLPTVPPSALQTRRSLQHITSTLEYTKCTTPVSKNLIEECVWAAADPELQKACFLARVCTDQPPHKCQFRKVAGVLQVGPTCGLTALSMLLGGAPATTERLLHDAQRMHYTINGEMFSAQNLFQLICSNLSISRDNVDDNTSSGDTEKRPLQNATECQMHEGPLNCAKVRDSLLTGACLFVPYDPDFNHAPCLKFGHKAHWALVIGYLLSDRDEFYVVARHGKARNLAVWSLEDLSNSNSNLVEFAQPKGYPDCDFLLPPGGIGGDLGLRERAIIVKGLPHEIITMR